MNFVDKYCDEYFKEMPLDQERMLSYEAVWGIRLLVLLGMGLRLLGYLELKNEYLPAFNGTQESN